MPAIFKLDFVTTFKPLKSSVENSPHDVMIANAISVWHRDNRCALAEYRVVN